MRPKKCCKIEQPKVSNANQIGRGRRHLRARALQQRPQVVVFVYSPARRPADAPPVRGGAAVAAAAVAVLVVDEFVPVAYSWRFSCEIGSLLATLFCLTRILFNLT